MSQINQFELKGYFDEILGISNIYAKSKIETGLDYIVRNKVRHAVLIGDTEHDYETAKALEADCIIDSQRSSKQGKIVILQCAGVR